MSVLGNSKAPLHSIYNIWLVAFGVAILISTLQLYPTVAQVSSSISIMLFFVIVIYAVGGCILSGIFSVGETKSLETLSAKIHGYGSVMLPCGTTTARNPAPKAGLKPAFCAGTPLRARPAGLPTRWTRPLPSARFCTGNSRSAARLPRRGFTPQRWECTRRKSTVKKLMTPTLPPAGPTTASGCNTRPTPSRCARG